MLTWQVLFQHFQQKDQQSENEEQFQQYFFQTVSYLDQDEAQESTIDQRLRLMKELPHKEVLEDSYKLESENFKDLSEDIGETQEGKVIMPLTAIIRQRFDQHQFPDYKAFGPKTNQKDTLFVKRCMIQPLKYFIAFRTALLLTPMYSQQATTSFEFSLLTTFIEKQMNMLFNFSPKERVEIIQKLFCIQKPPKSNQKTIALSVNDLKQPFNISMAEEKLRRCIQNGKFPNRYQRQTLLLISQDHE